MPSAAITAGVILCLLHQVFAMDTVTGQYGETVSLPCGAESAKAFFIKWKYDDGDGVTGDLLVRKPGENASITAPEAYKDRISVADDDSLLISSVALSDQKVFTCMMALSSDIVEHHVKIEVHKSPEAVELTNNPAAVETGKLSMIGECSVKDANPAATITWYKNDKPLEDDGKVVVITASESVDEASGLSSSVSKLQYRAQKEDVGALFSCGAGDTLRAEAVSFSINYPTETVTLEVDSPEPFHEGDDITLRCQADGNPPPTTFVFIVQGEELEVSDSDMHTLTSVTRDSSGMYQCYPSDDKTLLAALNITVQYLDVSLSPSGSMMKSAGEPLPVSLEIDASSPTTVTWTKDNASLSAEPLFERLHYSDSGVYECVVTMGKLSSKHSFKLEVEGAPVITSLKEQISADGTHTVLSCEAEGYPKPSVEWSGINGTNAEEGSYVNGKVTHHLKIVPKANLSVTCAAINKLGADSKTTEVTSLLVGIEEREVTMDKQDQLTESNEGTKMAVGIVVGLLLATVVVGVAYWLYIKKSKQGSWKTGEKEENSTEESKKLEETPQKAEV
ncbi:CD166 antigen homolog [Engraulis encrasicolus]|uniref:CD166 antigen homolog n=1 Tax=Engraulis encrasicolus TaxID=184585 RepID=UPI002FD4E4CC